MKNKEVQKVISQIQEAYESEDEEKMKEVTDVFALLQIKEIYEKEFNNVESILEKYKNYCYTIAGLSLFNVIVTGKPLWLASNIVQVPVVCGIVRAVKCRDELYRCGSNGTLNYKRYRKLEKTGALNVYIEEFRKMKEELQFDEEIEEAEEFGE